MRDHAGAALATLFLLTPAALATDEGHWRLVGQQRINRTSPPAEVTFREPHGIQLLIRWPDSAVEGGSVSWTPPAAHLVPGAGVRMDVAARITHAPPGMSHDFCTDIDVGFERHGITPGYSSGSGIGLAAARLCGRATREVSDSRIVPAPGRTFGDAEGRMVVLVAMGNFSGPLGIVYTYQWTAGPPPAGADPGAGGEAGPGSEGVPGTPSQPQPVGPGRTTLAGTSWTVGGHPVPWVFSADGLVEAKGLWTGFWDPVADGFQVTLVHQGVRDRFVVKLAADGRSFTAYKDGAVYRRGVRTN